MLRVVRADHGAQKAWNAFVASAALGSFLQSWEWGTFQEAAGFRAHRFFAVDDMAPEEIRGACLFVEHPLPLGAFSLYAPWGPVMAGSVLQKDQALVRLRDLYSVLRRSMETSFPASPVYARIEPKYPLEEHERTLLTETGFSPLGRSVQPQRTRILDLTQSEDDLLRGMHPKTRYNIRVAIRHGVTVEEQTQEEGLAIFLHLAREVENRGRFHYHPSSYYTTMLHSLGGGMLRLLIARQGGTPLAAGIFIRFGETLTYAHGASSLSRAHVMAPTLLHWEAILRGKAAGAKRYDFFGVASSASSQHPWAGITRFKRGFGGIEETYGGIADAVFDPVRYRLYTVARGFRNLLHH